MKESNKQRSARSANSQVVYTPQEYVCESERGDFKRRGMTVFAGYVLFLAMLLILLV